MLRASVSFFNEIATEKRKYARGFFFDHGFQEDNTLEGYHVKGQNSVMDSKRSSSNGRQSLWKEQMLRVVTVVRRSSSNNPIEEITM
jgi:hypothetical protein